MSAASSLIRSSKTFFLFTNFRNIPDKIKFTFYVYLKVLRSTSKKSHFRS
ncbi:hypothetical protein LEP1GSC125_3301 [Leptospira mayottensis 200901122]|uniref:Uncharacterized protein n=1 Tax=Leptospira mayottensis 200901122 TaxID=1193010 RepID=A0AA87SWY0_9LEPT|nr:hypothetical protein LEP1GSC125_3301 [Leptospira mayottensis 200901122]